MRRFSRILIVLFSGLFVFACEKETQVENVENIPTDYSVSLDNAIEIGKNYFEIRSKDKLLLKSGVIQPDFINKKVKEKRTLKKEGQEILHIINYEGGGFILISADKRVQPVLAYSNTDYFSDENLPGIANWVEIVKEVVLKAKKELKEPEKREARLWEIFEKQPESLGLKSANEVCNCEESNWSFSTGYTGFVTSLSQWSQGGRYSWYCPSDGGCNCNRKPTGCGPVAMSMIINYYQYSMNMSFNGESLTTNYPMPVTLGTDCSTPTNNEKQVAMLIRLCGMATNSTYGILGNCSTATYVWNVSDGFSFLGFSNGGSYGDLFDKGQNIISELRTFHPVIFSGTSSLLGFSDWHIWVGDGIEEFHYFYDSEYIDHSSGDLLTGCDEYSTMSIHMNWGWGPNNGNGYYAFFTSFYDVSSNDSGNSYAYYNASFPPRNGWAATYDRYLKAITGIRP